MTRLFLFESILRPPFCWKLTFVEKRGWAPSATSVSRANLAVQEWPMTAGCRLPVLLEQGSHGYASNQPGPDGVAALAASGQGVHQRSDSLPPYGLLNVGSRVAAEH